MEYTQLGHTGVEEGFVASDSLNSDEPLDFVLRDGGVLVVPEAAYRFCRIRGGCLTEYFYSL